MRIQVLDRIFRRIFVVAFGCCVLHPLSDLSSLQSIGTQQRFGVGIARQFHQFQDHTFCLFENGAVRQYQFLVVRSRDGEFVSFAARKT